MQEICQSGSGGGAVLSRLYLIHALLPTARGFDHAPDVEQASRLLLALDNPTTATVAPHPIPLEFFSFASSGVRKTLMRPHQSFVRIGAARCVTRQCS